MYSIFLKKNWNLVKIINNNRGSLLFVDRARYYPAFAFSFLAAAFSKKYKLNNIILTDLKNNSPIIRIYKSLGFTKYIKSYNILLFYKISILIKSFFYSIIVIHKIKRRNFYWFICNFKINQIPIGDLIYDLYIRRKNNFSRNSPDFYFFKVLFKSIFRFYLIEQQIKKNNVKFIFSATENYAGNDGLSLRIAIFRNIKNAIVFGDTRGNLKFISNMKQNVYLKGAVSSNRSQNLKQNLNKYSISNSKIEKFLIKREKLKTLNTYTMDTFKKANKFSNSDAKKFLRRIKSTKKKIILFACHALSDAAHSLGTEYAFSNYYEQLKYTLEYANNCSPKNYLWIVKSHPSSFALKEVKIIKELIKKFKNKNILFCHSKVNTNKLINISDYVISGRGTISLEATCKGKISINCGFTAFSNLGVVNEGYSKKYYFNTLQRINLLKRPSYKTIRKAKKILYILENDLLKEKIINIKLKKLESNKIFDKNIENRDELSKLYFKYYNSEEKINKVINNLIIGSNM